MIENGCTIQRFLNTFKSAWDIVDIVPEGDRVANILLCTQMVVHHFRLNETDVGRELHGELQRLFKDRKDAARRLKQQAKGTGGDPVMIQELNKRLQESENKIEELAGHIMQLKIPFGRKIRNFLNFR